MFVSYLADRGRFDKVNLRMNNDMSRFHTLVGASPGLMSVEEREHLMKD